MNRNYINLILASLAVSAALNGGTANASDHRMWRDQVAAPVDSVIELESKPADPKNKLGIDSLPWREQVNFASKNRVFILEPAPQRYAKTSDTRLWREQIESDAAGNKQTIVSDSSGADKIAKK